MYIKRLNNQKKFENTKNCNCALHSAKPIHKVYQRHGSSPTLLSNPLPKKVQKGISNHKIHVFTIFKDSPISLLPNGIKQTQRSSLPSFFSLFTNKNLALAQENPPNNGMQHPLNPKESKNQMPQKLRLRTM